MPRPRIQDVAARTGVSKTAVSFAFNQPEHLNEVTRGRILAAAADLGYRPSPIARRLAARRTDQIGLVLPQPTHDAFANAFMPELLRGIGDVCDERGVSLVIVPPAGGSLARAVEGAIVDGLILLGLAPDHPELEIARRAGLPVVALDVDAWGDADVVAIDDTSGTRQAAQHLYRLGHRDVAVVLIAEHPDAALDELGGISGRRLAGVRQGFEAARRDAGGTAVRLRILSAPVSEDGGRAAFAELAADTLPTAVLAITDMTAIGILNAAVDAGIPVPAELSVIGFDDIPAASWTWPRLTTVHQPIREKGRRAARRVIDLSREKDRHAPTTERLPTRLVIRGSTGPPRGEGGAERP